MKGKHKTTLQEFKDGLRRTREQNERIARFQGKGLLSSEPGVKRRGRKPKPISFKKKDDESLDEGLVGALSDEEES